MDGMSYRGDFRGTPADRLHSRRSKIAVVAVTAAYIVAMIGLTLLLAYFGWAAPELEQLGC